jgi:hypothetical protein
MVFVENVVGTAPEGMIVTGSMPEANFATESIAAAASFWAVTALLLRSAVCTWPVVTEKPFVPPAAVLSTPSILSHFSHTRHVVFVGESMAVIVPVNSPSGRASANTGSGPLTYSLPYTIAFLCPWPAV